MEEGINNSPPAFTVGDTIEIFSDANQYGRSKCKAIVTKVTRNDNVYIDKYNSQGKKKANGVRLVTDNYIRTLEPSDRTEEHVVCERLSNYFRF